MENLPGDYIAGFTDGEGCFALKFRRDVRNERKNKPVYFYWDIEFVIVLRGDDIEILEKIKETLGCGNLHKPNRRGSVRFTVNNINDICSIIVPFFEKYPLRAKKKYDFILWREAAEIFKRNQKILINRRKGEKGFHKVIWSDDDLKRLLEIHELMKTYKSNRQKEWKWLSSNTHGYKGMGSSQNHHFATDNI